jgi:hypothetical protein
MSNKEGNTFWVLQKKSSLYFEIPRVPEVICIQKGHEIALRMPA